MSNLTTENLIKEKIHTIRGKQVILDRDIANFYQIETKRLNEQVKRNIDRFPKEFMFQLTEKEFNFLRSQIATIKNINSNLRGKHTKYLAFVFTEQGVSMLSAVLNSKVAIEISIQIIKAFVSMRNFFYQNNYLISEINNIKLKNQKYDLNFDKIFKLLDNTKLEENQGIFFDGQIFDSHLFILRLIKKATKRIILIDNYVNEFTLDLFKKLNKIQLIIYSKKIDKIILDKFEEQYFKIEFNQFNKSHDRFLIIDDEIYHIGASLKDLGKKWFAFSKLELDIDLILNQLK